VLEKCKAILFEQTCYTLSLRESLQSQSCKAFTGLSNRVQMVGEGRPASLNTVFQKVVL